MAFPASRALRSPAPALLMVSGRSPSRSVDADEDLLCSAAQQSFSVAGVPLPPSYVHRISNLQDEQVTIFSRSEAFPIHGPSPKVSILEPATPHGGRAMVWAGDPQPALGGRPLPCCYCVDQDSEV